MIKAVLGFTVVAGGWLSVQMAWRRVFAGTFDGQNPMMDRCGGCGCHQSVCDAPAAQEDDSAPPPFNYEGR